MRLRATVGGIGARSWSGKGDSLPLSVNAFMTMLVLQLREYVVAGETHTKVSGLELLLERHAGECG